MIMFVTILFLIASVPSFAGDACNNKYKNLVTLQTVLANDPYAQVPPFFSISSVRIENFLIAEKRDFMQLYHDTLDDLNPSAQAGQVKSAGFFDWLRGIFVPTLPFHRQVLNAISYSNFPFTPDEQTFLNDAQQKNIFLMVRSSGLEDSKTTANAGLYVSVPYVAPNMYFVREAVAKVVESYFNPQALKNNLIAGLDLKNMPLCIPVLVQQLIGEPQGGTQDVTAIPVSGVAFTTQSGLSSEKFKVTEINASYGHGEGVVANKVSVDRYYVTESALSANGVSIYPMIAYKRQRLIPTQTGLQLATNPDLLVTQPCISTEQVEKLYKVLKKIETSYGQPMDVEFVIQKGTIYIVQARPAMQFEQKPSYIPDTQLTDAQLNSIVPVNTLVAGSSKVCIVTDPDKLIIKDTLDDADADERRSVAQAVFVGAWASSLSHAAVNFIGFGVPCFYVQDINAIKTLVASMSPTQLLIIDTQRQMVYLWTNTNKTVAQALQNGWYEHPIARSVSIIEGMKNYRIVRDVPVVPQDAVLIEKMHNLKNILGSDGQLKLYDEVMERIRDRMKLTEKRMQNKVALCDTVCTQGFAAFKTTLNALVDNFKYALENNADRLELLFYHKMLEALLYQDNDGSAGINRYTYRWFLDDLFIKQMLRGSLQVGGNLIRLLEYAKHCPDKELVTKWRECIQLIDVLVAKQIITQDHVDKLTNLLALLEKVDGVSIWFATLFYQQVKNVAIDASTIEKIVTALTQDSTDATQEFILFIKATQDNIATAHTLMQQKLETVPAFEIFWQELHRLLIYPLTNDQFIGEFAQASFLSKLLMCKELQKTIDILDESIKLMKSSRLLSFSNKQHLFNLMLKDFLAVCKKWLTGIMPERTLVYNSPWSLSYYLTDFDRLFGNIMSKTYFIESSYFQKSANFSVQAAILGSNTAFNRHYPETPEDLFMLIHQNSIVAVSATYKSLFSISGNTLSDLVYMPELFRTMFEYVDTQDGTSKSLIGIAYDDTRINLLYNMPLNNHSATFQLMYNFVNQEVVLQVQYLGQSRNRWEQIAVLAAASPELSGLVLEGPIVLDLQGSIVSCAWKVDTLEKLKIIMAYLKIMNDISFGDIQYMSLASINKTNQSSSAIFRQILPLCATRIKGSLQQNWSSIISNLR